jgi:hypothetical protein
MTCPAFVTEDKSFLFLDLFAAIPNKTPCAIGLPAPDCDVPAPTHVFFAVASQVQLPGAAGYHITFPKQLGAIWTPRQTKPRRRVGFLVSCADLVFPAAPRQGCIRRRKVSPSISTVLQRCIVELAICSGGATLRFVPIWFHELGAINLRRGRYRGLWLLSQHTRTCEEQQAEEFHRKNVLDPRTLSPAEDPQAGFIALWATGVPHFRRPRRTRAEAGVKVHGTI